MPNITKKKREKLLEKIEAMKGELKDEDMIATLSEIENELSRKKYGLVWEEHEENIEVEMKDKIPVFTELKERELMFSKDEECSFLLEGSSSETPKTLYFIEKIDTKVFQIALLLHCFRNFYVWTLNNHYHY